jgi:hypothetical protein
VKFPGKIISIIHGSYNLPKTKAGLPSEQQIGLDLAIDAWFEFKSIVILFSIDSMYHNVVCILNNNTLPYCFSGILILVP